ncbi:hypothetical protein [Pseudolysinimonas sp.]
MTVPVRPDPAKLSRAERAVGAVVRGGTRIPGLRRFLLWTPVARPGFWFATGVAWLWGRLLLGRYRHAHGVRYFEGMPTWAFGRGGTTIGAIYLTSTNTAPSVLEHEAVHVAQWRRYGLAFLPLYIAAGSPALTNRFEVEAGLEKGGYVRVRKPRSGDAPGTSA